MKARQVMHTQIFDLCCNLSTKRSLIAAIPSAVICGEIKGARHEFGGNDYRPLDTAASMSAYGLPTSSVQIQPRADDYIESVGAEPYSLYNFSRVDLSRQCSHSSFAPYWLAPQAIASMTQVGPLNRRCAYRHLRDRVCWKENPYLPQILSASAVTSASNIAKPHIEIQSLPLVGVPRMHIHRPALQDSRNGGPADQENATSLVNTPANLSLGFGHPCILRPRTMDWALESTSLPDTMIVAAEDDVKKMLHDRMSLRLNLESES